MTSTSDEVVAVVLNPVALQVENLQSKSMRYVSAVLVVKVLRCVHEDFVYTTDFGRMKDMFPRHRNSEQSSFLKYSLHLRAIQIFPNLNNLISLKPTNPT